MSTRRLLSVLVSFALSLQLVLAGGGTMCLAPSGTADPGMAGMAMGSSKAQTAGHDGAVTASPSDSQGAPCGQPAALRQCQLFASCASGFTAVAAVEIAAVRRPHPSVRVVDPPTLTSRTVAPELPPPRA